MPKHFSRCCAAALAMLSFTTWGGSAACAERLCIAMARPTAVENAVAATIRFMVGSSLLFRVETRRTFDGSFQVRNRFRAARARAAQDRGDRPTRRCVFIEPDDSRSLAVRRTIRAKDGGVERVACGQRTPPRTDAPERPI